MKKFQTMLEHRALFPENASAAKHPALVLLHGRGADEEDLLGLSGYFDKRLLVLSVRAPFVFSPGGGFTWYDVGQVGSPEPTMFRQSYEKLSQFVDEALAHYPVDADRVSLFGFSMGAVMSFAIALTRPELFQGVIAISGYVPERTHLTYQWQRLAHLEFFVAHGTDDPVIPIHFARKSKELFDGSNAKFAYKEYPMGHQISEESLTDSVAFLHRLLKNPRK